MIEMLSIYSMCFLENVTIAGPHDPLNLWKIIRHDKCQFSLMSLGGIAVNFLYGASHRRASSHPEPSLTTGRISR